MRFVQLFSSLSSFYGRFCRTHFIIVVITISIVLTFSVRKHSVQIVGRILAKIISDYAHTPTTPPYPISVFRHFIAKYRILFASMLMSKLCFRFDRVTFSYNLRFITKLRWDRLLTVRFVQTRIIVVLLCYRFFSICTDIR